MNEVELKMRVLLTNDDGIAAAGLAELASAFQGAGAEVVVAAPAEERSASSHSVSLRKPLLACRAGADRFSVSGTPVDAVNLALNHLLKDRRPDLVISGVNRGANLGCDIHYSGTVSAAREAAMLGFPALAVSLETFRPDPDFRPAAGFAVILADLLIRHGLPARTFLNVNVPDLPVGRIKGWKITVQGRRIYDNAVKVERDGNGGEHFFIGGYPQGGEAIPDSDIVAVTSGFVSVTPLRLDLTSEDALSWLRERYQLDGGPKPW